MLERVYEGRKCQVWQRTAVCLQVGCLPSVAFCFTNKRAASLHDARSILVLMVLLHSATVLCRLNCSQHTMQGGFLFLWVLCIKLLCTCSQAFFATHPADVCNTSNLVHTMWQQRMSPFGVYGNRLSGTVHCQTPIFEVTLMPCIQLNDLTGKKASKYSHRSRLLLASCP